MKIIIVRGILLGGVKMSNPILNENFVEQTNVIEGGPMTVDGTIQVTGFLGILLLASAAFVWTRFTAGYTDLVIMLMGVGAIGGFISALIIAFTRNKYLVPVYTVLEGLFLGGISAMMETSYPGIVSQAVAGTFAALFSMLILYKTGVVRCTDKFRSVVIISTISIAVIYIVDLIGHFFHYAVPMINTSTNFGIAFSAVVIVIAALNLILDFDFIERGAQRMLPKDYEWYGAFGLMVTIIWLYLEILKLLAKLMDRR